MHFHMHFNILLIKYAYLNVIACVHLELYDFFIGQAEVHVVAVSELESTFMKLRHGLIHV